MPVNTAVSRLLELRRRHVLPVAAAYHQELAPEATFTAPPSILLLGNHSSGKSSMINHFLGKTIQRTGIAPTDDGFTILYHGEDEHHIDGKAIVTQKHMPFAELARFGPGLTEHLRGRALPADLLRHVRLIDSPGMIDGRNAEAQRPYDFPRVVHWFAQQSDLVLLFFDPEKPGTTGETITILTEALSGIDNKLRIVMNKMDLFEGMRDFARTYGALCWNLSRSLPTKDLPHIYTTVIPALARPNPRLPLDGFSTALRELEGYIAELPAQRTDTVITRAIDETRLLHLRAVVVEHFRAVVNRRRWLTFLICVVIALALGAAALIGQEYEITLLTSIALLGGSVVMVIFGAWLATVVARVSEARGPHRLDEYLHQTHKLRLADSDQVDDLRHDWLVIKPQIVRNLEQIGLRSLRPVKKRQIRALQELWEHELPALRKH